jgi:ribose-phosphate pyrophosphokinase
MTHAPEGQEMGLFLTPESYAKEQANRMDSARGPLLVAGCRSGSYLSTKVVARYNELLAREGSKESVLHLEDIDFRFKDSETCVRLNRHVGGYDVFLFQSPIDPTSDRSIDDNQVAFLIAARAFREHGANRVTGVLPYLAYSRQDKPTKFRREPTTGRLWADISIEAGVDRLITWEPHSSQIHGFYGRIPITVLTSLALFQEEFGEFRNRDDVIAVAPDVGASKHVTHFSRAMGLKTAIASKYRPEPGKVVISEVIGDFRGKKIAIVLDDMISSGGTIYELTRKLGSKGIEEVHMGISHNLCVEPARERLLELHEKHNLKRLVLTNTIPQTEEFISLPFVSVRCLSDMLSRTINRIHYSRSVSEVFRSGMEEVFGAGRE